MTHRPAFVLACAFASGMGAGHALGAALTIAPGLAVLAMSLACALMRRAPWGLVLVLMAFFCGTLAACHSALLPKDHISGKLDVLQGREVEVVCRVASSPEKRERGLAPRRVFWCDLQAVDRAPCQGRIMVHSFTSADPAFGDRLVMVGKLARPFAFPSTGRRSYRAHLQRQGIHAFLHVRKRAPWRIIEQGQGATIEGAALAVRLRLQGIFFRYLSQGEAGLMNAMLLGPRGDIPPHVYDVFRKTGTAHIIAISGMNMSLTAIGVMFLLGLLNVPRWPRAFLAAFILALYSLVAGNSAPVARSAVMAIVVIMSFVAERQTDAFNDLGLAALVLLAADPGQLMDVGCQLSFVCVAALILLTPIILEPFRQMGWSHHCRAWLLMESAGVTLAAFIGSAGIMAYEFGYLTPIGLLVNLPVIPLMALVTALGALLLGTGLFFPWLAGYFALCLKVVLNGSVGLLVLASRTPVMPLPDMPVLMPVLYYAMLGGIVMFFHGSRKRGFGQDPREPGEIGSPQRLLL